MGNNLTGINDNVKEPGLEQKCFLMLTEGLQRWGRYHVVQQTIPDGESSDWEGPAADGRQFNGQYQQTIGVEGTPTRQIGDTNQLTQV